MNRLRLPQSIRADKDRSLLLTILSGTIAVLVASPLFWLLLRVLEVNPAEAVEMVTAQRNIDILLNSIGLMAAVTAFSMLLGIPLAVLVTRTDLPFKRPLTIIAALPLVIPSYIGAFAFVSTFGPHGEISSIAGIPIPEISGYAGAILIITLYTYPYVFLTARAALLSMDESMIDAARTLNATRLGAFRRVTLPQIKPAVAAGSLLVALYAISDFGTPAFMGIEVFTSAIYRQWDVGSIEYAALLSLQLIGVVAVVLLLESKIGGDEKTGQSQTKGSKIQLGRWRYIAVGLFGLIGIVAIALPVIIFGSWLLQDPAQEVPSLEFQLEFAFNSVYLAGITALLAAILSIPVGYLSARSDRSLDQLFERITYVGFAVPGVIIGLALVFFSANYVSWLYRTVPVLVFAYVVRFLPQAVGTTRSASLQVDQQLTEAAQTLNAGRWRTFREVTLPLIMPGVVAGAALVFLTTMKELPATLMLQPFGMETLVTIIWAAEQTLHYQYAAIPALALIIISGISMVVMLRGENTGLI